MDETRDAIKNKFAEIFESWGLELPQTDVDERKPGYLRQNGGSGSVRYVFAGEGDNEYLEFYSFHRIWGDTHARIYTDGRVEHLDVLGTSYIVKPEDPEATALNQRKMEEHNQKLLSELEEAGLMSGGPVPNSFTINAYLTTRHDDDQED